MNLPIVHGVPFSQPVRAVVWLLLLKEKPFEFLLSMPGSSHKNGSRSPEYLQSSQGALFLALKNQTLDSVLANLMRSWLIWLVLTDGRIFIQKIQERGQK